MLGGSSSGGGRREADNRTRCRLSTRFGTLCRPSRRCHPMCSSPLGWSTTTDSGTRSPCRRPSQSRLWVPRCWQEHTAFAAPSKLDVAWWRRPSPESDVQQRGVGVDEGWPTVGKQQRDLSRVSGSGLEDRACSQRRVPSLQDKKRRGRTNCAFAFPGSEEAEIDALNLVGRKSAQSLLALAVAWSLGRSCPCSMQRVARGRHELLGLCACQQASGEAGSRCWLLMHEGSRIHPFLPLL